jgi:hypothetical protein
LTNPPTRVKGAHRKRKGVIHVEFSAEMAGGCHHYAFVVIEYPVLDIHSICIFFSEIHPADSAADQTV